jgi:hypothetical protein
VNDLVSYLLAQARYRPVATARFAAGEMWRRGRLRLVNSLGANLPALPADSLRVRIGGFLPEGALEANAFQQAFPAAAESVRAEAEAVLRHGFCIFGERVHAGAEVDWHADWQSGYRWPLATHGDLRIVGAPPGTDVKRPWELARFHHLLPLGKAYVLTGDARFALEFAAQVRHFLSRNPYPQGIHWAMPMEAAIRAVNWTVAAAFFHDCAALEPEFWSELGRALFLHGRYVVAHREWNPVARGNHYLSCVAGMVHLGILFENHPEARRWLDFARAELVREMSAQVGDDGVAREGSSGYHAFLTELFTSSALLLARHDARRKAAHGNRWRTPRAAIAASCGPPFAERLERMFHFLAALLAGRERPPIWGDGDDGRLLPLCAKRVRPEQHLLTIGRALFDRPDWPAGCAGCEERWWRLGPGVSDFKSGAPSAPRPAGHGSSEAFPEAGFFFFSSSKITGGVRCGPLGVKGWANHAHCDQLSFDLCWEGRPVVVDPGSYVYSSDAAGRNLFRSTRYHNSPVVDGEEQNRFWPGLLFRMVDDTRSHLLCWEADEQQVEFAGEHRGYQRLSQRVRVERRIRLDRRQDALRVRDALHGSGSATLEWNWHFAPDIALTRLAGISAAAVPWNGQDDAQASPLELRAAWRAGPLLMRVWMPREWTSVETAEERGWVAPRYGRREEAPVLRVQAQAALPASVAFTFEEAR